MDPVALQAAGRAAPKSVRGLVRTVLSAARLVRAASPRLARLTSAGHLLVVAAVVGQVVLTKVVIDDLLRASREDGDVLDLIAPLVGLAVLASLSTTLTGLLTQAQRLLGEAVRTSALRSLLDVTTRAELIRFESPSFLDALQRVQINAVTRPLTLTQGLASVLAGALTVVVLVVVLLVIEPLLVPLLLLSAVPLVVLSRLAGRAEFDFAVAQTTGQRMRFYLTQLLTGRDQAKEVRAFELAAPLRVRWELSNERYLDDYRQHLGGQVRRALLGALVTGVVTSATLALLAALALSGRLSLAEAGAAVIAVRLLGTRVSQMAAGATSVFESTLFLREYEDFVRAERTPEARPAVRGAPLASVSFEDVSFTYPDGSAEALHGVTLTCAAGEVVAVVGENGSGKSTLAKLLGGLLAPTGGTVHWHGQDGRAVPREEARAHVGFVFQDFLRFALSARDNIALGRTGAPVDDDDVRRAARRAGAHSFLEALPLGYDSSLGREFPGGHDLSGGQWQRVALARAFLRDAPFLVLDEPTSALDARAEHELFERVRDLARDRGVVLISHRFSTVVSADRILVLESGRVAEEGTHAELMAARGSYAELYDLQAAAYR